jgi:hypothetical protein
MFWGGPQVRFDFFYSIKKEGTPGSFRLNAVLADPDQYARDPGRFVATSQALAIVLPPGLFGATYNASPASSCSQAQAMLTA